MIMGYWGNIRSGKTLSSVRELYKFYRAGFTIYSNIHLNFTHKLITLDMLQQIVEGKLELKEKKLIMFIDEIHIWLDSRCSPSKRNRIVSYFLLQSGKMGEDSDFGMLFFYTTQFLHQIDRRLRSLTAIETECEKHDIKIHQVINGELQIVKRKVFVNRTIYYKGKKTTQRVNCFFGEKYYKLYDTREVVKYQTAKFEDGE